MAIDYEYAAELCRAWLDTNAKREAESAEGVPYSPSSRTVLDEARAQMGVMKVYRAVHRRDFWDEYDEYDGMTPWAVEQLLWEVQEGWRADERLDLVDHGPGLDADQFHRWVWEPAKPMWPIGQYAEGLRSVALSVNGQLQRKVGRHDIDNAKLVQQVFSVEAPSPDKPRLRLCDRANEETFTSRHVGASNLGTALFMGVRNIASHTDKVYSEREALESLAAWSLFARWVVEARVVRDGD